ncbi:hypothetical protein JMF89_07550 [Clostridiaceae bacterium UIB06]|uniref:Uncharacterized protein n=1 Tax=Clostridium thailandense TaxID=2794346 RepID=A0A949X2U1_9CLOT|nr:hypothetical protein [Clostridium thailandense]MBV7273664.1 hypothetical protein [Clostridium thailandense]MCH5137056.1 hypothetical protein [Clostridiaceae bacterium UIB06]
MVKNKNTTWHYYRNEDGIVLYKVESSEWFQNGILKRRFRCYYKDKNIEPVLYALPSVIMGIKNNETIIYVEDEKSDDSLMDMGFIATTNFGGLRSFNSLSKKYNEQIKRANLTIFPNNSNRSKDYSKAVYNTFKNCCKSIGIIEMPDLNKNMSISDWLNKGVTKKQKEELEKIAPSLFDFNALSITSTLIPYLCSLFLKGKLEHMGIKYNHLLIEKSCEGVYFLLQLT